MISKIYHFLRNFFFILFIFISLFSINYYDGSVLVFLTYCFSFILMLYYLTDKKASYFEIFLSSYLFLGFWFKYVFSLILYNGRIFDSGQEKSTNIDEILVIGIIIAAVTIFSSFINKKFINKNSQIKINPKITTYFEKFYLNNRYKILLSFLTAVVIVCFINLNYGVYQRGFITVIEKNFILQNAIKWLMVFGFTTFSCFVINTEISNTKKISYFTFFISIFEIFMSYTSMLSRSFIINASSLLLPLYQKSLKLKKRSDIFFFIFFIILILLTIISIFSVNHYRLIKLETIQSEIKKQEMNYKKKDVKKIEEFAFQVPKNKTGDHKDKNKDFKKIEEFVFQMPKNKAGDNKWKSKYTSNDITKFVLVNRWIGIDSLILVHSSNKTSFDLLKNALKETKTLNENTFYEKTFNLASLKPIAQTDSEILKGNTLPGFVTFLYYSGNLFFLITSLILLISLFNIFEKFLVKLTNYNLIYVCFISNMITTRLIHFGYAPKDSYLFLISIFFSILFIYILNNFNFFSVDKSK